MRSSLKDRNLQIAESYSSGLSTVEVGRKFNLTHQRVCQILGELGIDRRSLVDDETLAAVADVLDGNGEVSIKDASTAHDVSASSVSWYLRRHHPDFNYTAKRREAIKRSVPHGTLNRYNNHRCRCDECREANAQSTVVVPVSVFDAMRDRVPSVRDWAIEVLKEAAQPTQRRKPA